MNLARWLRIQFHELTKPMKSELEIAHKLGKIEGHTEGYTEGCTEGYMLGYNAAFAELQAARAIDLAQEPITPYHPGDKLHAWNQVNKPNYRPIRLLPAARQTTESFPWLSDNSWLNQAKRPQLASYEPPDLETEHMPAFVKALHERHHERK